jgi:hypothetical protein
MNRRVLASAIAALLIGSGIGATVGSVAAKPSGKTVTVVIVHKKKGKTRWKTRVVVHTKTKTVTKIVTGHPHPKVRKYPGCPTEQTDPANSCRRPTPPTRLPTSAKPGISASPTGTTGWGSRRCATTASGACRAGGRGCAPRTAATATIRSGGRYGSREQPFTAVSRARAPVTPLTCPPPVFPKASPAGLVITLTGVRAAAALTHAR